MTWHRFRGRSNCGVQSLGLLKHCEEEKKSIITSIQFFERRTHEEYQYLKTALWYKITRATEQLPRLPYLQSIVTDDAQLLCPLAKALFPQQEVCDVAVLHWTHRALLRRPLPRPPLGLLILLIIGLIGAAQCIWIIILRTCNERYNLLQVNANGRTRWHGATVHSQEFLRGPFMWVVG